jgi:hypothetical protein
MGEIRLRAGKKNTGLKPGFIMSISSDNRLFAWDAEGNAVHFFDFERGEECVGFPLDRCIIGEGRGGESLMHLLAAAAGCGLEYTVFCDTKIRCRCEVGNMYLYRLTDPNRPPARIITLGKRH